MEQASFDESTLLDGPYSCILQKPTGSGKTWLARQAIERVVNSGHRAVYLTPLRALAEEIGDSWSKELSEVQIGVFTGDYGSGRVPYPVKFLDADLLVMTPERLDACTRRWRSHWSWIPDVDLIVVDEIHLLGESNRGARLEGAISRFMRLNPFARVSGLSATVGNPEEIAEWLRGVSFVTYERPVPLEWRIVRYRRAGDKPEKLAAEVARNVENGGASLVFVQSRRRAEELSRYLQGTGLRAEHHHAGLGTEKRSGVESNFRAKQIDALVATSTLEMGLNLPVRQVVLYDLQGFNGQRFSPLTTNTVWQRVGRAGRRGLDAYGEAVLLAPAWDRNADGYEAGKFESINSQIGDNLGLSEQIVTEVASGLSNTRQQLKQSMAQSFAAKQRRISKLDKTLDTMCLAGLLVESEDEQSKRKGPRLRATRLARIAVRHMLSPDTVLLFRDINKRDTDLTLFDLLLVAAVCRECEPVLVVDFEELDALACQISELPTNLLTCDSRNLVETLSIDPRRLLSAMKMAVVMREWTRTGNVERVAEHNDCYSFEVTRLRDSMSRVLLAFHQVVAEPKEDDQLALDDEATIVERVQAITQMVAHGLDELAVTNTFVKGIGGKMAKRLVEHGVADIEDLAAAEPDNLAEVRGLSRERAGRWISEAEALVETRHAFTFRETSKAVVASTGDWPADVEPYRLRRAIDLTAKQIRAGQFVVSGGLEPHIVIRDRNETKCDCQDFSKGHLCKHILAVRMKQNDRGLLRLAKRVAIQTGANELDLFHLWFQSESAPARKCVI